MQDAVYRLWLGIIVVTKVVKIILVSKTSFICFLLEATACRVGHPVPTIALASVTPTLCLFSFTGYMNLLCGLPLSNIFTVPPPRMFRPSQPCLFKLVSKLLKLSCSADLLISDLVQGGNHVCNTLSPVSTTHNAFCWEKQNDTIFGFLVIHLH